jgi:hypothetical protein
VTRRHACALNPWLNLCGQWGGDTFSPVGELHSGNEEIGRVQVTLTDCSQLVDDGTGDVALFVGCRGQPPASVDIYTTRRQIAVEPHRVLTPAAQRRPG